VTVTYQFLITFKPSELRLYLQHRSSAVILYFANK